MLETSIQLAKKRVLVLHSAQAARHCLFNVMFFVGSKEYFSIAGKLSILVFIVGPKRVVPCEDIFQAVDLAMKLFYVLNLKFSTETFAVWSFLQIVVYKLHVAYVPPRVDNFAAKLRDASSQIA